MGLYSRTLWIGLLWRGWGDIKYIEKRDKNNILPPIKKNLYIGLPAPCTNNKKTSRQETIRQGKRVKMKEKEGRSVRVGLEASKAQHQLKV